MIKTISYGKPGESIIPIKSKDRKHFWAKKLSKFCLMTAI